MSSSLVRVQTKRSYNPWNQRQRRTYQRLLSGLKRAKNEGRKIRILTLTSSPASPKGVQLSKNWQVLRKRIEKRLRVHLEYFRLRTIEGNGVLHIVYKGPFISQKWLSKAWDSIHRAPIVFIQALHGEKRLARYIVGRYISGHNVFSRQSWSWSWVFRGFVGVWKRIVASSSSMQDAIYRWNIVLRVRSPKEWFLENKRKKRWKDLENISPLEVYLQS